MLRYDEPIRSARTKQLKVAIEDAGAVPARGVGRGPKVRTAVLAATLAELTNVGYASLSVEGVAQRAGVNKTTVYRRWKDRESLVVDALTDSIAREVPIPDSGTIEGDLRAHAEALITWLTSQTGASIIATMISAGYLAEIAEIKRQFFSDRLRRAEPVIARAIARGELSPNTDPEAVIKTLIAPIYLRLLITAEPIDDSTAEQAARLTLAAARAGVLLRTNTRSEEARAGTVPAITV